MCYNCGCELPDDPMGKAPVTTGGPSLINSDLEQWAKDTGMSLDDVKANIMDELDCQCDHDHHKASQKPQEPFLTEEKLKSMAQGWEMSLEETKNNICHLLCETASSEKLRS